MVMLILLLVFIIGLALFVLIRHLQKKIGLPVGSVVYSDSKRQPGEILKSTTLPLVGKPDFIVRKGRYVIPVELKRGKTPREPYPSHIAQLYAYCLLVEENFGIRPPYGIIDYPEQKFELSFSEETEQQLRAKIGDILQLKNGDIHRHSFQHVCRSCREDHLN